MNLPLIAVSAKMGTNLAELLKIVREMYDEAKTEVTTEDS